MSSESGLLLRMACLALLGGACRTGAPPNAPASGALAPLSEPVSFVYEDVEKGALDSASLHGQPSVIVFITTYDVASQAQARFLTMVQKRHRSRIRAAAIVLERPENRPLVVVFRDALHLDYPVAMGDGELVAGRGPFGDVHVVPTTILLDKKGRIVWRSVGLAKDTDIEAALQGL